MHDGRREGGHDDLSHSGIWPTVFRSGRKGSGTPDGRTRVRIREADAGEHEHAEGEQSFRIPTRQLHEGAKLIHAAARTYGPADPEEYSCCPPPAGATSPVF